mmetsp:Transcript_46259/g.116493  ORF Transcript_46259/g.116493 Transcript_46259/m.116493 type:complete len:219 (+) Transcript_46259:656-1312(+)
MIGHRLAQTLVKGRRKVRPLGRGFGEEVVHPEALRFRVRNTSSQRSHTLSVFHLVDDRCQLVGNILHGGTIIRQRSPHLVEKIAQGRLPLGTERRTLSALNHIRVELHKVRVLQENKFLLNHLPENIGKTVHVGLVIHSLALNHLGCHIQGGTTRFFLTNVIHSGFETVGKTEITNLYTHILVHQNVGQLDIAMQNRWLHTMQPGQSTSRFSCPVETY